MGVKWWLLFPPDSCCAVGCFYLIIFFFPGKLSHGYLVSLLILLKRLIQFLETGVWNKKSEKKNCSFPYFLGLEFIVNKKVTLKNAYNFCQYFLL